jgi:hypothetical protein
LSIKSGTTLFKMIKFHCSIVQKEKIVPKKQKTKIKDFFNKMSKPIEASMQLHDWSETSPVLSFNCRGLGFGILLKHFFVLKRLCVLKVFT